MSRSVSYASGAVAVAYAAHDPSRFEEDDFDFVIEDLQNYASTLWPSLSPCDEWLGREDHAILENDHCFIGLSEYCGLISYWLIPKDEEWGRNGIAAHWCEQIKAKFLKTFGTLRKVATFSNGEAVFERIEPASV